MSATVNGRACVLLTTLSCLCCMACGGAGVEQKSRSPWTTVSLAERLYVASLSVSMLDRIYASEFERLDRLCAGPRPPGDTCWTQNLSPTRHRVAVLFSAPDTGSAAAAYVHAATTWRDGTGLGIALYLELAERPGEFLPWIDDVGDWGYGIEIDGYVWPQTEWVEILHPAVSIPAWVKRDGPDLSIHVDTIAGQILYLEPLLAAGPDGVPRRIERGPYLITAVTSGGVEFRAEVPSDFACGEDIPPPAVWPPVLRARAEELFHADRRPRFSTVYSKGC